MHLCGSSWKQDRQADKHTRTQAANTQMREHVPDHGEEDVTLIWENATNTDTHACAISYLPHHHHHHIHHTHYIHQLLSEIKRDRHAIERGSNPHRDVQQLATIKSLWVWMWEKRNVWKKKKKWDEEQVPWIYCPGAGLTDPPPQLCQRPVPAEKFI